MEFFRQEYCNWSPLSPPRDLPHPGIKPASPASPTLAGRFFTTSATWEPWGKGRDMLNTKFTRIFRESIYSVLQKLWGSTSLSAIRKFLSNFSSWISSHLLENHPLPKGNHLTQKQDHQFPYYHSCTFWACIIQLGFSTGQMLVLILSLAGLVDSLMEGA